MFNVDIAEMGMILASYLLGSIPFGLFVSKLSQGIDPRQRGSGNIGATNVLRVVGRKEAVLTLISDILKGFLAVAASLFLGMEEGVILMVSLAAILGHIFPLFLKFKGGKGVATSFGVFLGLSPQIAVITLAVWIAAAYLGKYSSVGALAAFGALPVIVLLLRPEPTFILFASGISILIYIRHWENIHRLLTGTEGHPQQQ